MIFIAQALLSTYHTSSLPLNPETFYFSTTFQAFPHGYDSFYPALSFSATYKFLEKFRGELVLGTNGLQFYGAILEYDLLPDYGKQPKLSFKAQGQLFYQPHQSIFFQLGGGVQVSKKLFFFEKDFYAYLGLEYFYLTSSRSSFFKEYLDKGDHELIVRPGISLPWQKAFISLDFPLGFLGKNVSIFGLNLSLAF